MNAEDVGNYWEANAPSWTEQVRKGLDVYRDLVNTPAFLELLPDVTGLDGLDIGCGEGANTRILAKRGARMSAIDISPSFVDAAKKYEPETAISYLVADAASLPFSASSFNFTTAFMSLMDMPNQQTVLAEAHRVTKPGGFLQFSILHPCFVPSRRKAVRDEKGEATGVLIMDYFTETNGEVEQWHFSALPASDRNAQAPFAVPRFHRTLATWVDYICKAGWKIEAICEPSASPEAARQNPIVADTRIAPLFLIVRCRRS